MVDDDDLALVPDCMHNCGCFELSGTAFNAAVRRDYLCWSGVTKMSRLPPVVSDLKRFSVVLICVSVIAMSWKGLMLRAIASRLTDQFRRDFEAGISNKRM